MSPSEPTIHPLKERLVRPMPNLVGVQKVMLYCLEGLAQSMGQCACQDILRLPQLALLRLDRITLCQLLLCCACIDQVTHIGTAEDVFTPLAPVKWVDSYRHNQSGDQ